MIYDPDMEVRGEQQVVTEAMISVLHYKSVLDTDSSHGVTTASIFTLARLLDTGNSLSGHRPHLHQLLVNVGLVEADIHGVPGGHHVVVVDHLKINIYSKQRHRRSDFKNSLSLPYQKPGIGLIFSRESLQFLCCHQVIITDVSWVLPSGRASLSTC